MPIIDNFSGGLITGVDPIYLNSAQSAILLDANIERLGLQSDKQPALVGDASKSFYQFFVKDSEPEEFHTTSSTRKRSYAEFFGSLCYSDGGPVCKITDGTIDTDTGDFLWNTLGVEAVAGEVIATPITLDDISGAAINLVIGSEEGDGYLSAEEIRYRIVDANDTVYITSLTNNTGYSTATIVLPDNTYKVYREVIGSYGEYTDKFLLVGQGSFTDGLTAFDDNYTFVQETEVANFSGHRLSLLNGLAYSVPYTTTATTLTISSLKSINSSKVWQSYPIDIRISHADISDSIASTFVYHGAIYVMAGIGNKFYIYKYIAGVTTKEVATGVTISQEFFKGTTVERGGYLYFFNPLEGKVATFDGSTFVIKDWIKFPYAKSEDSLFTLKEGTDEVYAIINGQYEANIRKITLPSLEVEYVDNERTAVEIMRGLGGTSGSVFTDGDFQVFPIHNAMIRFSPSTSQLIQETGTGSKIPTLTSRKGFVMNTASSTLALSIYTDYNAEQANIGLWENDLGNVPTWFNVRTLTGTYLYNVSQRDSGDTTDGPIMDSDSTPVSIYKGHIRVNLTGIIHTNPLRLYRTGGYLTAYTMVENIDPTTEYLDKRDDVTIALGTPGTLAYSDAPPENLQWLTEHRGMLFGAVGNVLYWCQPGQPHAWDKLNNYIIMDRHITALGSCVNGLVIFMKGRTKLLAGYIKDEFRLLTISNSKGTTDSWGVQSVDNGVLFFGDNGLCFTDGALVQEVSYGPLGEQDFDVISSASTDRYYYALVRGYTNSSLNEARVILRLDYGGSQTFTLISADGIEGLGVLFGRLAHSMNDKLYDTFSKEERVLNYKSAEFTGNSVSASGEITGSKPTHIKEWDRVRASGEFVGTIRVFIDNEVVIEEEISIDTKGVWNAHIPKRANKGKTLQFEVLGKGTLTSLEYSLTERKTTK